MRKAILASIFLTVALVAFGQHGKSQIGGKAASNSKVRPKAKPKATPNLDKPWDSPCGVHYENLDALLADFDEEWRPAAENAANLFSYNTHRTTCNRENGILSTWVKNIVRHPTDNVAYAMVKYELKCPLNQYRVTAVTDYDKDGQLIGSSATGDESWDEAEPDSMIEGTIKVICHKSY